MLSRPGFDRRARVPAAILLSCFLAATDSFAASQESARDARGWMPDVAERREDLARREERDAREAAHRSLASEQWWRGVAAAPVQGRLP